MVVHEETLKNGLAVRHQGGDLFRLSAQFGPVFDNALDVSRTVLVRDPLHGQPGLDNYQRVSPLARPRNAVRRVVRAPESPGRVYPGYLQCLERNVEGPTARVSCVCVEPPTDFTEVDRVDGPTGQVVGLVVAPASH